MPGQNGPAAKKSGQVWVRVSSDPKSRKPPQNQEIRRAMSGVLKSRLLQNASHQTALQIAATMSRHAGCQSTRRVPEISMTSALSGFFKAGSSQRGNHLARVDGRQPGHARAGVSTRMSNVRRRG